jgi:hypothetical protein
LYRCEDEAVLVKSAAEKAEREWREKEGFSGGWQWEGRERLISGSKSERLRKGKCPWEFFTSWEWDGRRQWIDWIVDGLTE